MRYVYSLVRFVPDPGRGEFINVGAIVGSEESSEWEVRQLENPVRARAIDERGTLEAAWGFLDRIGREVDLFEQSIEELFEPATIVSEDWLRELSTRQMHIVQVTAPTPLVAENISDAVEKVFGQLVLDPARPTYRFQKKHAALAAVRRAYRSHGFRLAENVFERVTVRTRHHSQRTDFAVANGLAVQLTQTWSFQVPEQDALAEQIKAWGWTMREVQQEGGSLLLPSERNVRVPESVSIAAVFVPPERDYPAPAFEDAQAVVQELGAILVPLEQANEIAVAAEKHF
jgi:Protein of unknown function (DUF3037)